MLLNLDVSIGFYLILNVAVGGTNGWFPDGPEKPWLDGSSSEYSFDTVIFLFLVMHVLGEMHASSPSCPFSFFLSLD
jgi:hypothetical protein